MKSFYVIIKVVAGPASQDSLAVGLILFDIGGFQISFSDRKIKLAQNILHGESELLGYFVEQLKRWIDELNIKIKSADSGLFPHKYDDVSYFQYLNKYSNNILQFSKPIQIEESTGSHTFRQLFILLVDSQAQPEHKVRNLSKEFELRIKHKLIDKVEEKVHTYLKLNEKALPSLYFTFVLDCIGMNGVITAAKSIDFNQTEKTIDTYLSHYFIISSLISRKYNLDKKENNFFLIADEPSKINSKEHMIWEHIREQKNIIVIDSEESDAVTKKIFETNAKKFLEFTEQF